MNWPEQRRSIGALVGHRAGGRRALNLPASCRTRQHRPERRCAKAAGGMPGICAYHRRCPQLNCRTGLLDHHPRAAFALPRRLEDEVDGPGRKSGAAARCLAAPSSIVVWPSWRRRASCWARTRRSRIVLFLAGAVHPCRRAARSSSGPGACPQGATTPVLAARDAPDAPRHQFVGHDLRGALLSNAVSGWRWMSRRMTVSWA